MLSILYLQSQGIVGFRIWLFSDFLMVALNIMAVLRLRLTSEYGAHVLHGPDNESSAQFYIAYLVWPCFDWTITWNQMENIPLLGLCYYSKYFRFWNTSNFWLFGIRMLSLFCREGLMVLSMRGQETVLGFGYIQAVPYPFVQDWSGWC